MNDIEEALNYVKDLRSRKSDFAFQESLESSNGLPNYYG